MTELPEDNRPPDDSSFAGGIFERDDDNADGPPPRNDGAEGEGADVPPLDEGALGFMVACVLPRKSLGGFAGRQL